MGYLHASIWCLIIFLNIEFIQIFSNVLRICLEVTNICQQTRVICHSFFIWDICESNSFPTFTVFSNCHSVLRLVSPAFIRKTLEMHIDKGHSTCQSEPTHQKDLRCPFCLYQTKNKNNMIDHVVLHRGRLNTWQNRVFPLIVMVTLVRPFFFFPSDFRGACCSNRGTSPEVVALPSRTCFPLSQMYFYKWQCWNAAFAHDEAWWHQTLQVSAVLLWLPSAEWLGGTPEW